MICEGASDPDHGCFVAHREPLAFHCVDIQVTSPDWPYEDPNPQYGTECALVPIADVLGVNELPPEHVSPSARKPQTLRPEDRALLNQAIFIDDGRGMTPLTPGTPAWDNLHHLTRSGKLPRRLREIVGRLRRLSYR